MKFRHQQYVIRIHQMNLKDLSEWLYLDCSIVLTEEGVKGLTKIDMSMKPDKDFNLCNVKFNLFKSELC